MEYLLLLQSLFIALLQVRDLMFFMEAQAQVKESPLKDEIQGGSVTVGDAPTAPKTSKRKGKK